MALYTSTAANAVTTLPLSQFKFNWYTDVK